MVNRIFFFLCRWYHACFAFDNDQKKYITWLNGEFEYELPYDLKRTIYGDFAMIGQGGEISESFSGELSQVLMIICYFPIKQIIRH